MQIDFPIEYIVFLLVIIIVIMMHFWPLTLHCLKWAQFAVLMFTVPWSDDLL